MRGLSLALILTGFLTAGAQADSARSDYLLNCMGCHLMDGAGTPGKVPALKGQVAKFLHVDGGRAFLVQVPGTSQSQLDDARTAHVLNYILTTFDPEHLPDGFEPYTKEEITGLRGIRLANVAAHRADLAARFEN